jgi:hypothetical protein
MEKKMSYVRRFEGIQLITATERERRDMTCLEPVGVVNSPF